MLYFKMLQIFWFIIDYKIWDLDLILTERIKIILKQLVNFKIIKMNTQILFLNFENSKVNADWSKHLKVN